MTIDEMKERKKELGYSYEYLVEISGVPLGTIQKIFTGVTKSPRYATLKALEKALQKQEYTYKVEKRSDDAMYVKEAAPNYKLKKKGEYTLQDYYALPEEKRVELIDGVFYDMTAPTTIHQLIISRIFRKLDQYIEKNKGTCMLFTTAVDVQLDQDDKTMVQPDVLIVCNRDIVIKRCIYGAPDFIVEVLSASTRKKDATKKLTKYMEAGVREYWMVDPDKQIVVVYHLEEDIIPAIYGFDSEVPVKIFGGECKVDFKEIYEYVKFLYEK